MIYNLDLLVIEILYMIHSLVHQADLLFSLSHLSDTK